ncbi:MAG: BBP7 family outer membrane beta-barrel protein [Pirellulaceae bacterium]
MTASLTLALFTATGWAFAQQPPTTKSARTAAAPTKSVATRGSGQGPRVASGKPTGNVRPAGQPVRRASAMQEVIQEGVVHEGPISDGIVHEGTSLHGHSYEHGEVVYDEGSILHSGPITLGGGCSDGSCGDCSSCSVGTGIDCGIGPCTTCLQPTRLCICLPAHGWVQLDYLMWWQNGAYLPPMAVTGSGTGIPNLATGSVLYGDGANTDDDTMFNERRSGGRLRFGWGLARFPGIGIQGEYIGLADNTELFEEISNGSPTLGVPYLNATTGNEQMLGIAFRPANAQLPHVGSIRVDGTSSFEGGSFHFNRLLCCNTSCAPAWWGCESVPVQSKWLGLIGYRYLQLDESLSMQFNVNSPASPNGLNFSQTTLDQFTTRNQFNGPDWGIQWSGRRGYWSMDLLMRTAMGVNRQVVSIDGSSTHISNGPPAVTTNYDSGLFATTTNEGNYSRSRFAVIPEMGMTVGYQLTERCRFNVGYTFIYWSSIVRPGDQIDRELNPANIPAIINRNVTTPTNPRKPNFDFVESDYWVQGLSLGMDYRW